MENNQQNNNQLNLDGILLALGAFGIWGLFPAFFKLFEGVDPWEVLAHRIVWSLLATFFMLFVLKRLHRIWPIMIQPRVLGTLLASALLIAANWGIFIYAIGEGLVLESSLGYFITPLMNIALGVWFLKERLNKWQWLAVTFGLIGVLNQVIQVGEFPWIAILLAITFSLYALVRKMAPVDAITGLYIETVLLIIPALIFIVWLEMAGVGNFWQPIQKQSYTLPFYLFLLGGVTTIPLVLFAASTKKLPLSMVGFFQYLTPTGHFLLAIFAFGEDFDATKALTFSLIWAGLFIYTVDLFKGAKKKAPKTA